MGQATTGLLSVLAILILTAAISVAWFVRRRRLRELPEMDELEGHEFEYYCADLLEGSGYDNVRVTKGSGDFGVDIFAEREGIRYAIQCKCYGGPVGVKAVQEVYAGRDFYDCMVGVVMTNTQFTAGAERMAEKLKILLWDRERLEDMEEDAFEQRR